MAPYLDLVPQGRGHPVIFDDHNCEYLLQRRAARPIGAIHCAGSGRLPSFSGAGCTGMRPLSAARRRRGRRLGADAGALRAIVPSVEPLVLPNGIDVAAYRDSRLRRI